MRRLVTAALAVALAMSINGPAAAQQKDETLADIRQELSVLYVELQRLKRELSTTGGVTAQPVANSVRERVNLMEDELARLAAKTEKLEKHINSIVKDGTNRLGDLEYRLVELEGGDVSKLGENTTLGGALDNADLTAPAPDQTVPGPELAVDEQADFDRATAALDAGDNAKAAQLFTSFSETYPDGPLSSDAQFFRGEALLAQGDTANAARAYLESFSGAPDGERAPDALYKLGLTLGELGQVNEACVSLGEVAVRFPDSAAVAKAQTALQDLNCP
jgi:tol-pal system protein YbgF